MKRSEIVSIIEEYLCRTEHLDIPCSLSSDFKAAAEELVLLIEKSGMLPPTVRLPAFGVKDNAWEPEEERENE